MSMVYPKNTTKCATTLLMTDNILYNIFQLVSSSREFSRV